MSNPNTNPNANSSKSIIVVANFEDFKYIVDLEVCKLRSNYDPVFVYVGMQDELLFIKEDKIYVLTMETSNGVSMLVKAISSYFKTETNIVENGKIILDHMNYDEDADVESGEDIKFDLGEDYIGITGTFKMTRPNGGEEYVEIKFDDPAAMFEILTANLMLEYDQQFLHNLVKIEEKDHTENYNKGKIRLVRAHIMP